MGERAAAVCAWCGAGLAPRGAGGGLSARPACAAVDCRRAWQRWYRATHPEQAAKQRERMRRSRARLRGRG